MEHVILVDANDDKVGTMEKLEAHTKGLLHRAFSIILFNSKGEILLQKRATTKYHSGGLWSNTCCSHPLPNETMREATQRKLQQEMGIDEPVTFAYKFIYKVSLDKELIENECDHVFIGYSDKQPIINKEEVEDWKYISAESLLADMTKNPDSYTEWLKLIMKHQEFIDLLPKT